MKTSSEFEFEILDLIKYRRSYRSFSAKPIEVEKIKLLFEAARWAPSSSNEQPWAYVFATKEQPELWSKIYESLNPGNQIWAKDAHLLVVSLFRKNQLRNGSNNEAAKYDVGAANALLSLQATALELNAHQMGGFNRELLHKNLNVPPSHDTSVVIAIGYLGNPESLPDQLKERELSPRVRYTQEEFVMNKIF